MNPADAATPPPTPIASWRFAALLAAGLAIGYVALATVLLPSYGPTWDELLGELPGGEKLLAYLETGDARFLDVAAAEPVPSVRAPHPEFPPGAFALCQISTVNSIASALTCRVLWDQLGWLPAIEAHHFAIVAFVASLVFALVMALTRCHGAVAGVSAAFALLTAPRFFAHGFNNLKDTPVAALYAIATLACFAALRSRSRWAWAIAGVATGIALASKANALFVPVQMAAVWLICRVVPATRGLLRVAPASLGIAALGVAAGFAAVSPDVWAAPIDAICARFGEIGRVGHNSEVGTSTHGLAHFAWTTPPLLLLAAAAGLARPGVALPLRVFLACGIAVPVGRTLIPGMVNFDGVRHFLEFYPSLAAAAGLGIAGAAAAITSRARSHPHVMRFAVIALALAPSMWATIATHPNGVCYYNSFVGGLRGAQQRGIVDATDYWGNSYRQGIHWLNQNAEPDSRLIVPIGGHIVASVAAIELRDDIELLPSESRAFDATTYVMFVTRPHRVPFLEVAERELIPVHTIEVQGAPILRVLRLTPGDPPAERAYAVRERGFALDVEAAYRRLGVWLYANPDRLQGVTVLSQYVRSEHRERAIRELRGLLPDPPFDAACFEALVWYWSEQ